MMDQLKQNNISILSPLPKNRFENIFNVYEARKGDDKYFFYNLGKKINLDLSDTDSRAFKYIKVNRRLPWTSISYQEYKTQHLWWLILAANKITNPIILPKIGDVLRIIRNEYIDSILSELNT
jgi:hypothetical protein